MKLYEWDFAPNCRRVRMFLLEKGIEVEREECITSDIILSNGYRDRYAHYMVPMLELDDGTQLGEALSIWHFFDTLHPDPPLMGSTAVEKATISAWERRAYDEGMVGHAEIFRNSHPNFVDRGLPGHTESVPQIPDLVERGKLCGSNGSTGSSTTQLADNTYIAGETFSTADITTITVVDFGHAMEMQIPESTPHVRRWYEPGAGTRERAEEQADPHAGRLADAGGGLIRRCAVPHRGQRIRRRRLSPACFSGMSRRSRTRLIDGIAWRRSRLRLLQRRIAGASAARFGDR